MDVKFIKIFLDNLEALEALSHYQRGKLILAILRYANYREEPDLLGTAKALFGLYKAQVDRDFDALEELTRKKRYAGALGGRPKKQKKQMLFEESTNNLEIDIEKEIEEEIDIDIDIENRQEKTTASPMSLSPSAWKRDFENLFWVQLSDSEYQSLLEKMGKSELDRLIRYVDELAQQNGNKYGWKDWVVVLRRAYRENWGRKKKAPQVEEKKATSYDREEMERLIAGGRAF